LEEICDGSIGMSRSRKVADVDWGQKLNDHVARNAADVVTTLNSIGLWHISPCTDVGFKHVLKDDTRAIRFISSFSELLDAVPDPSCRMLDEKKILKNRRVDFDGEEEEEEEERSIVSIERIPESIGYTGEVIKKQKKRSEKSEGSVLPEHPKIDSGFIVGLSDEEAYKMGIEMQVEDKGNMPARVVDYGSRIFRYKGEGGEEGSVRKVFELVLNRWGITNAPNKLVSISGKDGAECDKDVGGDLVDSVCLCCVSIFLGQSIDIIGQITDYMRRAYPEGSDHFEVDDQQQIRNLIQQAMRKERRTLSKQVMTFTQPGRNVSRCGYRHLSVDEKKLVDRLGFFKYGHLMSEEDVQALGDEDLINDYQCIKIQEENIMENIDQVSAIWGSIDPSNAIEVVRLREENRAKDDEIARLREQLGTRLKTPAKRHTGRRLEPTRQKGSNPPRKQMRFREVSESSSSNLELSNSK
jgi:hypothetical protein